MAATEREFAKAATVKGLARRLSRILCRRRPPSRSRRRRAKEGLLKQPSTPFSEFELVWEPRTGDVSASGDLGWLTGPSTSINHKANPKGRTPGPGMAATSRSGGGSLTAAGGF